jgi:hypothetical protein
MPACTSASHIRRGLSVPVEEHVLLSSSASSSGQAKEIVDA